MWFSVFQTVSLGGGRSTVPLRRAAGVGQGQKWFTHPPAVVLRPPSPRVGLREASPVASKEDGWGMGGYLEGQ